MDTLDANDSVQFCCIHFKMCYNCVIFSSVSNGMYLLSFLKNFEGWLKRYQNHSGGIGGITFLLPPV